MDYSKTHTTNVLPDQSSVWCTKCGGFISGFTTGTVTFCKCPIENDEVAVGEIVRIVIDEISPMRACEKISKLYLIQRRK